MKKLILILVIINSSLIITHSQGWVNQNSGTNLDLRGCFFTDVNTGYVVGGNISLNNNQIILKTTNSGINWFILTSTDTNYLYDICFINNNTGIAVGWNRTILRTTNSGLNWSVILRGDGASSLQSVSFADSIYGNTVGSGAILRTTNGGLNWFYQYNSSGKGTLIYYSVYLINNTIGIATSFYSLTIRYYIGRTVNGGTSWPTVETGTGYMYDISFANTNTGIIVGQNGRIYKTNNSGVNWISQNLNVSNTFLGVHLKTSVGYIVGTNGIIFKTTDSGNTWNQQFSNTGNTLYSVYFLDNNIGFTIGSNGTILKTTNGGALGIEPINSEIPEDFSLSQNYPNPFNPMTKLKFQMSNESFANLIIYDVLGREVATLVNEQLKPGTYEVEFDGSNYPSGIYFYKLSVGEFTETRKAVLVK